MRCPHCNSPELVTDRAGNPWYKCGTTKTFRSASCIDREPLAAELRNALAHIQRLEEAGDYIVEENDIYIIGKEVWQKAKEAKP